MFTVNTEREGHTRLNWERSYIVFRKPGPYKPELDYQYVQAKCDGHRVMAIKVPETNSLMVVTTSGHDVGPQLTQCGWYHQLCKRLQDQHWFDGEVYLPGKTAEHLKTAMVEGSNEIEFAAFGYSLAPGTTSLEELQRLCDAHKIKTPTWSRCKAREAEKLLLGKNYDPQATALENVRSLGVEFDGVVFKNGMYSEWGKLKHRKTVDCVVTGLMPGKGKYKGMVGSLACSVHGIEIAKAAMMPDEIRAEITENDIGRVVEVEYERVASQGRLRHPRFLRWRDDKRPDQCTVDQDPDLVRAWT